MKVDKMTLYDVIQMARILQYSLCFTLHDTGYYCPAQTLENCKISSTMMHDEVRIFTIDFEEKIVFANVRGCDE